MHDESQANAESWPPKTAPRDAARDPTSVLVIEIDEALAELETLLLRGEGFQVTSAICDPATMRQVLDTNPDVIVLGLGPHTKTCGWQLLEDLRTNPNTQGIPLLVVSDTEQLLQQAKQNFDVRQEILKPYDIANFVKGVRSAVAGHPLLPHPAHPPTTGPIQIEAAQVISERSGGIMAEWLQQVQQSDHLGSPPGVPLRVLMNNISVWLIDLVSVLRYGSEEMAGRTDIREKLAGHIREARQHGINLPQIITQFEILRNLVWEALAQSRLANLTPDDVFRLAQTVHHALDEVIIQVAKQYERPASRPTAAKGREQGSPG